MDRQRLTVLYVDDDPDCLDVMRTILESQGHEMVAARSGKEGRIAFQTARPDLVFVDLMMEEIDAGTQFVHDIRALDDDVPICMISAVGDALHRTIDLPSLGVLDVLQKPIRGKTILALLESVLTSMTRAAASTTDAAG